MKMSFKMAVLASMALAMSCNPAVSQISECGQLRIDLNSAQQDLAGAQSNLSHMDYDRRKANIQQWHDMAVANCYVHNAPGMDSECVLDADIALDWDIQALDDEKSGLEYEVSNYESIVQDYQQRLYDAHC